MELSLRRRLVTVLFLMILGAMVVLPTSRYVSGDHTRFGWAMFSFADPLPTFTAVTRSGETYRIDPSEYFSFIRQGLPAAEVLPPHLCLQIPELAAVLVETSDQVREVLC